MQIVAIPQHSHAATVVNQPHTGSSSRVFGAAPVRKTAGWAILKRSMLRPRLFLIDSYGFIFRAYHARARSGAPPMRTSTGISTEAVYIFHNMLRKLANEYKPDYVAAVWESSEPTFRSESFADYKANRTEMPE